MFHKPKYEVLGQVNLTTGHLRGPFEKVYPEADKIFNRALSYYLTNDVDKFNLAMQEYHRFLASVGWTEMELDQELLAIIDNSWEI